MKQRVCLFAVCLLLLAAGAPALAENTSGAENPTPIVLLSDGYNPFFSIAIPESYWLVKAEIVMDAEPRYILTFGTSDALTDILAFIADTMFAGQALDIAGIASSVSSQGWAGVHGRLADMPALIQITDHSFSGEAETAGRFTLEMQATLGSDPKYEALIAANMRHSVLEMLSGYIPVAMPEQTKLSVMPGQNRAELYAGYPMRNAETVKAQLLEAYPDQYYEPSNWMVWRFGDMQIAVTLDGAADGELGILINLPDPTVCLCDYVPRKTLKSLGFVDFRETSAKCTNQNNDAGVWLSVSKDEWGVNSYENERNGLTFMTRENDAFILINYDPRAHAYNVTVEYGGEQAKYRYLAGEDRYIDEFGGEDLAMQERIVTSVFPAPDEGYDDALSLPWSLMDAFLTGELQTTADELYALDYE